MNRIAFEEALDTKLQNPLENLGFKAEGRLSFARATPVGSETLRFGGRLDEQTRCQISGTAGVCFREINNVLTNKHRNSERLTPTIVIPLHLLHADREYVEWTMVETKDAEAVAVDILAEISLYALPFFERYRDIEELKRRLESPVPADWFVLTPEQRVMILAAIDHVTGSPDRALRLIDTALAERAGELPKKRVLLERLRERLRTL